MLSRFALNDIVPEEFKTLSFNHVLLHKKDIKMGKPVKNFVCYLIGCSKFATFLCVFFLGGGLRLNA